MKINTEIIGDVIPVDILANLIIASAWDKASNQYM